MRWWNFATIIIFALVIGVGAALWQAKPGERLKDSGKAVLAVLAISLAGGLAALLGVPIKGISE